MRLTGSLVLGLLGAFGALACGSEEKGASSEIEGSGGVTGNGGTGGTVLITTGSTSATGSTGSVQDGGSVDLTEEQVAQIESSACAGWAGEGEAAPAVLQLVVDVSGSMEDPAPGSRDSKWSITHDALLDAIESLGATTAAGMLLYPNTDDTGSSTRPRPITDCVRTSALLPIAALGDAGSAQRLAVEATLDDADTGGGTPTHDAYRFALEEALLPYQTPFEKFMLLITDGQPTYSLECTGTGMAVDAVDPQPIIEEIRNARESEGIRTFVIGSPGSERAADTNEDTRPWLSTAASVGGTAAEGCSLTGPAYCHMDMSEAQDFSTALRAGLAQIIGQLGQCTYDLPTPPAGEELDPTKVNLILASSAGTKLVLPDEVGDCTEGWRYNAEGQVVLCPSTCDEVQNDITARVQLLFGCVSGEVPQIR